MQRVNDPEGRTERWVKWSVAILLVILIPIFTWLTNVNNRLIVQETTRSLDERNAEVARRQIEIMQKLTDNQIDFSRQHELMIQLLSSMAGDETYQKEVARERQRYRSDRTPVFGPK